MYAIYYLEYSAGLWGWRGGAPHQGAEQFGAPSASAFYVFFMCMESCFIEIDKNLII